MDRSRYFDHAATTPVDAFVREAMMPFLGDDCGNAHSLHQWGLRAREAVEGARQAVARLLGAEDPSEVVFTSGATESNNTVLAAFDSVAVSPFEHSSVREPALSRGAWIMSNEGWTLSPPSPVELVSVMTVNNETGALLTMPECPGAMRHTDATQAVGKLAFDATAYDFVSCSGHKFYGPKGVGALFLRGAEPIEPLLRGGGQEHGVRAGTLNVPGIVGMGMAAELAHERRIHDFDHAVALRGALFGPARRALCGNRAGSRLLRVQSGARLPVHRLARVRRGPGRVSGDRVGPPRIRDFEWGRLQLWEHRT